MALRVVRHLGRGGRGRAAVAVRGRRARDHPALPDARRRRGAAGHPGQRGAGTGGAAARRRGHLDAARPRGLAAVPAARPLGRRVPAHHRSPHLRRVRHRQPPRPHRPPAPAVGRARHRRHRGTRRGLRLRARLVRLLAHRRRPAPRRPCADHRRRRTRRLGPGAARARRVVHHPGLRGALQRRRLRRGEPRLARLPAGTRRPGRRAGPAGPLQLLGGDDLRHLRGAAVRPRPPGRRDRRGTLRRGRRLVRRPHQRPRRARRLDPQPRPLPERPAAPRRTGARPRHGVRHLGRTGDGQPGQRAVPGAPRLGPVPTRPRPHGVPQPAGPQPRPRGRPGACVAVARRAALQRPDRLREVGLQPLLHRRRLARGALSAAAVDGPRARLLRPARPAARRPPRRRLRVLFGRRRADRPRGAGPHRPGVDLRQHRPAGPARHPARLQPDPPGPGHGRLGHRQPEHPAQRPRQQPAVPVRQRHGGRPRHRRRPRPVDRGGTGGGPAVGGPVQGDPPAGPARRPVPAAAPDRRTRCGAVLAGGRDRGPRLAPGAALRRTRAGAAAARPRPDGVVRVPGDGGGAPRSGPAAPRAAHRTHRRPGRDGAETAAYLSANSPGSGRIPGSANF
ncbi:hypothetical protein SGPA1_10254 [Streptomyces misionensis JCM 4497]